MVDRLTYTDRDGHTRRGNRQKDIYTDRKTDGYGEEAINRRTDRWTRRGKNRQRDRQT